METEIQTESTNIDTQLVAPARSRRALLAGALGGLAAAVAAALGRPGPAAAAAGGTMIIGSEANNAGSANTQLLTNSSVVAFKLLQNGPGTALMGYATPATGATRGVYGRSDSPNGYGVQARNAGAAGTGAAIQAIGVNNMGLDASSDSDTVPAVRGVSAGGATGVYGSSAGGTGLQGATTAGFGVVGTAESGVGMYGASSSSTGVYGGSSSGIGVRGVSTNLQGVRGDSTNSTGVVGNSVAWIGVYGGSTDGYGVYAYSEHSDAGRFGGSIYADSANMAIKNFKIDHPQDPAGKVLMHSCVESNERLTVYAGTVTTDVQGEAEIGLPGYFGALNRDLRYQLTPLADARAWVKAKVSGTRFTIATSEPGVEVCWQVTGVRQDAYAKAHPLVVESAKTGREKGRYLNPVEHGKPESAGVDYELREQARRPTPGPPVPRT